MKRLLDPFAKVTVGNAFPSQWPMVATAEAMDLVTAVKEMVWLHFQSCWNQPSPTQQTQLEVIEQEVRTRGLVPSKQLAALFRILKLKQAESS